MGDPQEGLAARQRTMGRAPEDLPRDWQTTFDAAADAIWLLDRDCRIVRYNKAGAACFRQPGGEIIGRHCWEVIHGTAEPHTGCPYARLKLSRQRETEEILLGDRWCEVTVDPILDDTGALAGAVHVTRDITERKRAEEALRQSELRYRRMTQAVTDYVYTVRVVDGRPVETVHGAGCAAVTGYTSEELCADASLWIRMVHEADREAVLRQAARVLAGAVAEPLEHRIWRKDGLQRWVQNTYVPQYDARGQLTGYDGLIRDITDRKWAEDALRESEERFRVLAAASFEGIVISSNGVVLDVNEQWAGIMGCERRELIGQPISVWVAPEDLESVLDNIRHGREATLEHDLIRKDGTRRSVEVHGRTMEYQGRAVRITTLRDITARKRAEAERTTIAEILSLLNSAHSTQELVKQVIAQLLRWSGCTAVGIRLREGDDYPYFETRGLPGGFVQAENHLCTLRQDGGSEGGTEEAATLECMCGRVLRGEIDATRPGCTAHGSFWTNSTTQWLVGATEADRPPRPRNRCHTEGFESLALVPLRCEGQMLGLLQFCDRRRDRFTPANIAFLETVSNNLAIGLAHRRTARALEESAWFNQATLDGLSAHIAIVNAAGTIEAVNTSWRSFAPANGVPAGTVCEGVNYLAVCAAVTGAEAEVSRSFAEAVRDVLAGRLESYESEYACHSPEVQRWFVARVTRFPGDGPPRAVIAHENITELKQREQEKAALEAQLQQAQKLEAVGQLAGGVAHDFNNLLTVIAGHTEVALSALDDNPAIVRSALHTVDAAARQATDITHSLLTFSQQYPASKERIDLRGVVEEAIKLLRHFVSKNIALELSAPAKQPLEVHADPSQIIQIILNLGINARDAMPQGGQLCIRLEPAAGPPDSASDAAGAGWAQLTLTDSGMGIPAEILPRIFEPFFTTKPRDQGTGLGLAVVHGIVEAHGGRIEVQSERGRGTTFKVLLPCAAPESGGATLSAQGAASAALVLVVTPDAHFRAMLASFLRFSGYDVVQAGSEEDALTCCQESGARVRLAILDQGTLPGHAESCLARLTQVRPELAIVLLGGEGAQPPPTTPRLAVLPARFEMAELAAVLRGCLAPEELKESRP